MKTKGEIYSAGKVDYKLIDDLWMRDSIGLRHSAIYRGPWIEIATFLDSVRMFGGKLGS